MLHIYPVILAFVTDVHPLIARIARHDPDLAKQLRRASTSVVLNTAEGMYARGRQRAASYNVALREMRESYAALEVSVRLRYLAPLAPELEQRIARILGTLVRLSFRGSEPAKPARRLTDEPAEDVLQPNSECEHDANVIPGASAERAGYLDRRARLAALSERDGVGATLVRQTLASRALGRIERGARGALARLLPQLRVPDARAADQLHELESELISDELVMRK